MTARRDARLWASARNLPDLADLTARWLTGDVRSQPGYDGPCDIDEAPGLREALVACNRAGYLTRNSQEGHDGPGWDGAHYHQLAAVYGFAHRSVMGRINLALWETRFEVHGWPVQPGEAAFSQWDQIVITFRNGEPCTIVPGGEPDLDMEFEGCDPAAVADVMAAWHVVVVDPEAGQNDLWPALAAALALVPS